MPNGISCAYFAAKNYMIGKEDDNAFRLGIAGAQSARTINCITQAVPAINNSSKMAKCVGSIAAIAKKIVYPLIISSGIYTTFKSKDKVKTGISQTTAISSMYACEQTAESILKTIDNKVLNTPAFKNNKYLKYGYYVLKGSAYAASSLFGYNAGSKLGSSFVDKIRSKKFKNYLPPQQEINSPNSPQNNKQNTNSEVFNDIKNALEQNQNTQNNENS